MGIKYLSEHKLSLILPLLLCGQLIDLLDGQIQLPRILFFRLFLFHFFLYLFHLLLLRQLLWNWFNTCPSGVWNADLALAFEDDVELVTVVALFVHSWTWLSVFVLHIPTDLQPFLIVHLPCLREELKLTEQWLKQLQFFVISPFTIGWSSQDAQNLLLSFVIVSNHITVSPQPPQSSQLSLLIGYTTADKAYSFNSKVLWEHLQLLCRRHNEHLRRSPDLCQ